MYALSQSVVWLVQTLPGYFRWTPPWFFPLVFLVTVDQCYIYYLGSHCKSSPFASALLTVDILTKIIQYAVSVLLWNYPNFMEVKGRAQAVACFFFAAG